MGRQATFIVDTTGPQLVPLDEIPEDVKAFVEDSYEKSRKTAGRIRVQYDTPEELAAEFKLMVSYAAQRKVNGKAAILKIRRSPTRESSLPAGLADRIMDFRVTHDVEANGAANANKPATGNAR